MKLEITKEKVLEAASKCSRAKETLKTLFPEVFESDKSVDLSHLSSRICDEPQILVANGITDNINLKKKSFALSTCYNWQLVVDDCRTYLVPTKK